MEVLCYDYSMYWKACKGVFAKFFPKKEKYFQKIAKKGKNRLHGTAPGIPSVHIFFTLSIDSA
jgi:hypothetical protein